MKFHATALIAAVASSFMTLAFGSESKIGHLRRRATLRKLGTDIDADPNHQIPLGLCEGDCDSDSDCETGLKCFQRSAFGAVPGCDGGEQDSNPSDYCILNIDFRFATDSPTASSAPTESGEPSPQPSSAPSIRSPPTQTPSSAPSRADGVLLSHPTEPGGDPSDDKFPLGHCEGDCDENEDCAEGLYCFKRDPNEEVAGCSGGDMDSSRTDYCTYIVLTSQPTKSLAPSQAPTEGMSEPTAQSNAPSGSAKPTTASAKPSVSTQPSPKPSISLVPTATPAKPDGVLVSHPAEPDGDPLDEHFPLGLCEGDCDEDVDCAAGLFCFKRDANKEVPGCIGGDMDSSRTDYCTYNGFTSEPTTPLEISETPSLTPSSSPSFLPSAQLSAAPSHSPAYQTPQPTVSGQPSVSKAPTSPPSSVPTRTLLQLRAYPGDLPPPDAFPLGPCEGDCDFDSDCDEGLYCLQRDRNDTVPGCIGGEEDRSATDYCTYIVSTSEPTKSPAPSPILSSHPSPGPSEVPSLAPSPEPSTAPSRAIGTLTEPSKGTFPLDLCEGDCDDDSDCAEGLYCFQRNWNETVPGCIGGEDDNSKTDYCTYLDFAPVAAPTTDFFRLKLDWQAGNVWDEKNWCIACRIDCSSGDDFYITECFGGSTYFEFIELITGEILIEVSGTNLCMQRSSEDINLRTCNPSSPNQRWFASDSLDDSFEISQFGFENHCVSQEDQPDHAEIVGMELCSSARVNNTSVWTKY